MYPSRNKHQERGDEDGGTGEGGLLLVRILFGYAGLVRKKDDERRGRCVKLLGNLLQA